MCLGSSSQGWAYFVGAADTAPTVPAGGPVASVLVSAVRPSGICRATDLIFSQEFEAVQDGMGLS